MASYCHSSSDNQSELVFACLKMKKTLDEWVDHVSKKPSLLFTLMVMSSTFVWAASSTSVYLAAFQGRDPEPGDWECVTDRCKSVNISTLTQLCDSLYINKTLTMADIKMQPKRTSFAIDFNIFCKSDKGGQAKKTLISSMYFVGALIGLISGGYLYDNMGRKKAALSGVVIAVAASFVGTFCKSYALLLALRVFHGIGNFLVATAVFIWTMEVLPSNYRNYANGYTQTIWCVGYPVVALLGYLIPNWNHQYLACCVFVIVCSIPILFIVESPRFYMIVNRPDLAKDSIQRIASLNGISLKVSDIEIKEESAGVRQQSILQQLKEFVQYPVFVLETVIMMLTWFLTALSYYGFNFGWGSLVPNVYLGYVIAGFSEFVSYVALVGIIAKLGRRRSLITLLALSVLSFLVSIADVNLGAGWSLESVSSLMGLIFVSAVFSAIYLYSSELAPTSHRGVVFALSSGSARIGSFLGPFVINNLYEMTHKGVPLGVLSFLGLICIAGMFYLVETNDKEIPNTPAQVKARRAYHTYRF